MGLEWFLINVGVDLNLGASLQAGNYVREDLVNGIIATISAATELHGYCAQKLYTALLRDISQVGGWVWCTCMWVGGCGDNM